MAVDRLAAGRWEIFLRSGYSWRELDKETAAFILFLVFMAVYYGWRMFALTPWYDELYTYYYFISRGPVYAAIHWPLPNNHIGYSVLSACLGVFGNAALALRGISYLSSLGSLVLLFLISRKCFGRGLALVPVFLYTGMKLTNQLAVQGRGYAFVTLCYLTAVYELLLIVVEHQGRIRNYLLFGISLIAALYAVPSSVYVVIPVCLTGGIVLLLQGEYRRLVQLIVAAVISAVCTVCLYAIVWLAIGSNLLVKTEGSVYYGMRHAAVLLQAPFTALRTGIEYMLATPYIQSVGRERYFEKFAVWMKNLLNEYYSGSAGILAVLLVLCAVAAAGRIGKNLKGGRYRSREQEPDHGKFMDVYLAVSIVCIPLMLILQSSLPYYRVFSFAGVVAAYGVVWLLHMVTEWLQRRNVVHDSFSTGIWKYVYGTTAVICAILCLALLLSPAYTAQYSDREAAIEDALEQIDWTTVNKAAVTDCDQEYLLLFLYDMDETRITRQPEEADVVLADRYLLLGQETDTLEATGDMWKLYMTGQEFVQFVEKAELKPVYENNRFVLFQ